VVGKDEQGGRHVVEGGRIVRVGVRGMEAPKVPPLLGKSWRRVDVEVLAISTSSLIVSIVEEKVISIYSAVLFRLKAVSIWPQAASSIQYT
jgi:hypothetical protein